MMIRTMDSPSAQAMLLAAGRGNRMRPLTDTTPKPLLLAHGKPLVEWPMRALAAQDFVHVLLNTGWLGAQIPAHFGACHVHGGALPDSLLQYSREDVDFGDPLETAGGIARALPALADVFWLAAGDVYAPDFVFARAAYERFSTGPALAHIWLVPNPSHNPNGDFALSPEGIVQDAKLAPSDWPRYTYSTIGLYRKALFAPPYCTIPAGNTQGQVAPLAPVLRAAMAQGLVTGSVYSGRWTDVGTPERLQDINNQPR